MADVPKAFWLKLYPIDPSTGSTVEVLLCSANRASATTIESGKEYKPYIETFPKVSIAVFTGEFDGTASSDMDGIEVSANNSLVATFPGYVWDGAAAKLYKGNATETVFANLTQIFDGVTEFAPEISENVCKFAFIDHGYRLERDYLTTKFAGTGGLEGPVDIANTYKPVIIGSPLGVEPYLINSASLVFMYHGRSQECSALAGLYENGLGFGAATTTIAWQGSAAATYTALTATALTLGQWADAPSIGCFRLGGEPKASGVITCDPVTTTTAYIDVVMSNLVTASGLSSVTDSTNLSTFRSGGYNQTIDDYVTEQETCRSMMERYLKAVGGYFFWNQSGGIRFGLIRMTSPSLIIQSNGTTSPVVAEIKAMAVSAPFKRLRLGADKCFRVHNSSEISDALYQTVNGIQTALTTLSNQVYLAANDGWLTIEEKIQIVRPADTQLSNTYTQLIARATALGLTYAAVTTAKGVYDAGIAALSPALATNFDTDITGITAPVFRTRVVNYANALKNLEKTISEEDAKRADWPSVTGSGRPSDNAGAILSLTPMSFLGATGTIVGNTVTKTSAAAGWDYGASAPPLTNTAFISGRVSGGGMIGLATTQSGGGTSAVDGIEFPLYFNGSAWFYLAAYACVTAGGAAMGNANSTVAIVYDGGRILHFIDGVQVQYVNNGSVVPISVVFSTWNTQAAGQKLWPRVALYAQGWAIKEIVAGPWSDNSWVNLIGAAKPSDYAGVTNNLVAVVTGSGAGLQQGNTLTKISAPSAWDTGWYTRETAQGNGIISFTARQSAEDIIVTLTDVASRATLTSGFGFNLESNGNAYYIFGGTAGNFLASYVAGDNFTMTFDGVTARFFKNAAFIVAYPLASLGLASNITTTDLVGQVTIYTPVGQPNNGVTGFVFAPNTANNFASIGGFTAPDPFSTGTQSIVPNGGAERGDTNGWSKTTSAGTLVFDVSVAQFNSGQQSFRINKSSTSDGGLVCSAARPVTPGRTYQISVWVKSGVASGSGGYVYVFSKATKVDNINDANFENATGLNYQPVGITQNFGYTTGWVQKSGTWTCPAGQYYASIAIYNASGGPIDAYFDDVYMSDVEPNADVTLLVAGTKTVQIAFDYLNTVKSGQLPYDAAFTVKRLDGTDLTTSASWAGVLKSGTATFTPTVGSPNSTGVLNVTAMSSDAVIEMQATYGGKTVKGSLTLVKNTDPPPVGGGGSGGSGTSASTGSISSSTSASYGAANTSVLSVQAGSGGTVSCVFNDTFQRSSATGIGNCYGKWQWRVVGGVFADITTEIMSDGPSYKSGSPDFEVTNGSASINMNKTGLTNGTTYEFQLLLRSAGAYTINHSGTASATGS